MDTNQCQVCGNFFITLTSLNNHIETHSKKELYHCILGLRNTIAMLSRQPLPETTYQDNITATDLSQNHHAHNTSQAEKPTTSTASSAVLSIPSAAYEIHTGADGSQPGLMHLKTGDLENSVPITPPNQNLVNSELHATETGSSHHNAEPLQSVAAAGMGSVDSAHAEPTTADMLTCPICKKKLTSSYTLYRHMQSHYDKQADSCQVCGKEFVGKRSLVVHMRTHTGERPYKCNTCGKQFAQYGTLYRHRQIHNKGDAANNGQSATAATTTSTATTAPSLPPPDPTETAPMEDPTNQKQHLQQHHHHNSASLKHLNNATQSLATGGPNTGPENGQELSAEHRQERMGLPTVEHRESSEVLRPPEKTTILSVPSTENMTHDQQEMGESSAYPNTQHVSDTDAINNLLYQHVFGDQQQFLQGYLQNQLFAQTLARFPNWGSEFALMAGYPGYAGLDYKKPEQDQNYDMAALPNPQVEKARNNDPAAEQLHDTFSDNSVTSSKSERLESFSSLTESLLRRRNQSPVVTSVNSVVGPGIPSTSALPDPPNSGYPSTLGIQPPPPPSYEAAVQQSLGSPALLNTQVVENDQSQSSSSAAAVNMTVELSCKVCAQKFQTSAELTKHMSIHNEKNFVWCQVCHSKFTTPFSLRRHMKIHTGERDEVCGVCGKRFIDKPRLVVHMRTHTGEKPYACSICPKTFSRREVLKRHEKTHSTFKPVDASTPKSTYDELPRKQEVEVRKQETEHTQMDSGMYLTFDEDKVAMTTYLPSEQHHHPPHPEHQDPEIMSAVSEPDNTTNESRYMYTGEGIKSSTPPVNDVMYQHGDVPIMPQQEEVSAETSDVDQTSPKNPESQQEQSTDTPSDSGSGKEVEIDRDSRAMNEINDMLMRNFTSKVDGAKPYQCDVCNRKYTMQSCLRRHMLVHTGLKPNRCQVCGKSFVEKQQLLVHFRIHTGERPHQCSVCGKRFTQYGTLHNHMQVHRKQQYNQAVATGQKSDDEGSSFIIKKELSEEEESLPKKSQELVNGESGPSDMESTAEQEIQSDLAVAKSPYTSDESRSVDISNKMRTNAGATEESQNNLSEVGSEVDGENSKAESVEKVGMHGGDTESTDANEKLEGTGAVGSKTDRPAYDFLYGYPTTSLMSLNLLANTSEVHQSLMEHMAQLQRAPEMHQGLLEYMAQLQRARMVGLTDYSTAFTRPPVSCTYTSSSDIGLNLTTSENHAKVLGLSCDKCDAKFQDQETLESHMKTHALKNGNDAMLSQASSDATSPTKTDKFHTCKTCGKSFSASFCLRRHEMIHSGNKPYKCEYCPKAFVEKQHLTCHVRIHTGEKPYSCSTCGKAFTQYGTLHKHLRTHNKNKPHKCQFCEKAYYERRQLTNHLLTHFENKGK